MSGVDSSRMSAHAELSALIGSLGDDEIVAIFEDAAHAVRVGWGTSRTIELGGRRVFVKALPVTDAELDDPGSTANHFDLPVHYQYGVGSAGFGSAREVAAHHLTTRWVLDGECEHFPLLYHQRLVPLGGQARLRESERIERYVDYWDGDPAIRRFIRARSESRHAFVLFIEHIPHVLADWLPGHQEEVRSVIEQGLSISGFLRSRDAAHFDLNDSNIVTDGTTIYAADFGPWLDPSFDLADDERHFLSSHRYLDAAEFLASLEWQVPGREVERTAAYRAELEPYRAVIDEISAVFERLRTGPKHQAGYDDERIAAALEPLELARGDGA